ncbi:MAG: AAA family ATPase [Patescibacteria group bacterium]|nr:AAA family ATPase [Patescibacteria group bacterium]
MYLKKLEISGFKSFANKTTLNFPRGITAVVGPNGSGKSNIADAVKWVLGEQSIKSLRGKKGEDVIFTGSDKKSKMSVALVSLYFDNSDKKMPLDYEEVILTRKLFRNGDSEYLINKSKARLIDIVELLAKSGVSQRGYCVINQGMADSILVATPAERMIIFEEATGVRKFQIKKQRTISKLESTKRNLQRVLDLLNEIEPRLNSLKRQANKAQKRGSLEEELKSEQKKLFSNIWSELNGDNEKYRIEKEEAGKFVNRLLKEIEEIKNKLSQNKNNSENYQERFDDLQKETALLQEVINDLQKSLSILEGRMQIENERKEKIENPEFVPINLGYVKEKISRIISMYDKFFDKACDSLQSSVEKLQQGGNEEIFKLIKKEGTAVRKDIEALAEEIKEGRVNQKNAKIKFDDSDLKKIKLEKEKTIAKIKEQNKKYEKARNSICSLNNAEQEKRKSFFELEKSLQIKQDELNKFKDNLNQINIELAKFEVRKEDLMNEIKDEFDDLKLLNRVQNGVIENKESSSEYYFDKEESRLKIRRLKIQLEQIGGIDPLIVEEYEETKNRFEFLSAQSNDLEQASEKLRKVIGELDQKVEEIFKSSFKKINQEFDKYFKIIFGGGKASLSVKYSIKQEEKSEEENSETEKTGENKEGEKKIAGIEIEVFPPGKKISSLNMLSGGERALTSVAILFAIISNNPPPFSVLDEIDAALDESNSEKIAKISNEVSSKTQFIVITHNREMMKYAKVLYGVTMQNDGVSKIISLELEKEKK